MTPIPDWLEDDAAVEEAMDKLLNKQMCRFPVVQNGKLVGLTAWAGLLGYRAVTPLTRLVRGLVRKGAGTL